MTAASSSPVHRVGPRPLGTLRRWQRLPPWEEDPAGYLLRQTRESAGVTQREMGSRLAWSQQAVTQAERWSSNPTVRFLRAGARALGLRLDLSLE